MRRPPRRRTPRTCALCVLLLLGAAAAEAYTIYLKDGSRLVAQKKYQVAGERALFTLENGTRTFVPAAEIDVQRTEEANRNRYGDALVLRDDAAPPAAAAPPPRRPLADLAARSAPAPREPAARRETARRPAAAKTGAGFPDFLTRASQPYPDLEVAAELQQIYHGRGIEEVQVFAGTRGDRPFVEITTNSEASVLRALTASAEALLQLRRRLPGKVATLELLMTTPARERAGQFVLTPEMAEELAGKRVEVTAFFVRNVQF